MSKGFIFDLVKLENGWIVTLFSLFKIAWINTDIDNNFYKCCQISFGKLQLTLSIGWKHSSLIIDNNVEGIS